MANVVSYSSLQEFSKRIVQEKVLPGPRPRVPTVQTSRTYQGTPDLALAAIPFEAIHGEEFATNYRVRRAVQDGSGSPTNPLVPSSFQGLSTTPTSDNLAFDIASADFDFKKLSMTVLVDPLLAGGQARDTVLKAQIELARRSFLWGLSTQIINNHTGVGGVADAPIGLFGFATDTSSTNSELKITSTAGLTGMNPERAILKEVHQLKARATSSHDPVSAEPDAFIASDRVIRRLVDAQHFWGVTPEYRSSPLVGGRTCYHIYGVPVLPGPCDETGDKSTMYAVRLTGPSGIRVAHLGGRSEDFGIMVERQPKDFATGAEGAILQGYYALIVPEPHSVVALVDVDLGGSTDFPV